MTQEATKTLPTKSNRTAAFNLGRKQGKIKRLQTFDSGFLVVKTYFDDDESQDYNISTSF